MTSPIRFWRDLRNLKWLDQDVRIPDTWQTVLLWWSVMILGSVALLGLVYVACILAMDFISWWALQ